MTQDSENWPVARNRGTLPGLHGKAPLSISDPTYSKYRHDFPNLSRYGLRQQKANYFYLGGEALFAIWMKTSGYGESFRRRRPALQKMSQIHVNHLRHVAWAFYIRAQARVTRCFFVIKSPCDHKKSPKMSPDQFF
jgi:hypothetical protein